MPKVFAAKITSDRSSSEAQDTIAFAIAGVKAASSYDDQCQNDDVFVDPIGYACRAADDLIRLNSTKCCGFRIPVVSESGRSVTVPSRWAHMRSDASSFLKIKEGTCTLPISAPN